STGHDEYLRGSRWDFTSCYNCHLNSNTSSQVNFGGSCSSSSCHNSELGGAEACNTCHGNFGGGMDLPYKWAPPSDLQGEIQTTNRGVGAHQTHLRAPSGNFLPVTCTSCHTVPSGLTSEGHLDSATPGAEVIFSELAAADSVDPNYDNNELTCSVYCHGESNPIWTEVNGSWNECNSCHDYPTDLCNTQSENCGECHSRVMDLDGNIISPELHLNGRIEID
ncbi:MAG: hypothetical protein RAP03_13315, partial [Candidatus Electryonea clarkiae]|nr:hypothetical protein [Candidatus Electryonea clarkiae]